MGSLSKCSKARITVLPCQVVPSTPCLSWSLFGPSFCYCSAPWYLHQTPPSFTPNKMPWKIAFQQFHLLTWKPPVWSLRPAALQYRSSEPVWPLETCTWMWAHDTRRHIDALKTGLLVTGWNPQRVRQSHQSRSQWGFRWAIEIVYRKLFLPNSLLALIAQLVEHCPATNGEMDKSNLTRRKPSRTEGLLKSLQSVYCT